MRRRKKVHFPVLAIDYGTVRLGVAISDALGVLARPLTTIYRQGSDAQAIAALMEVIAREKPAALLLGMPYRTDGRPGEKEQQVRAFAAALSAVSGMRPFFEDERWTTVEANDWFSAHHIPVSARREIVDQLAATMILQHFLDEQAGP